MTIYLDPIKKPHTNLNLVAKGCGDLPATKIKHSDGTIMIYTTWKVKSFWTWFKMLFVREITLGIWSHDNQPPVTMILGDHLKDQELKYESDSK